MSTIHVNTIGFLQMGAPAAKARHGDHSRRVLMLLPVIWGLNLVDLLFTLLADATHELVELNPLASSLGPIGRILLKLAALTTFTIIIVAVRRGRWTEYGCYLMLAVYSALAVVWLTMFPFLLSPCYFRLLAAAF